MRLIVRLVLLFLVVITPAWEPGQAVAQTAGAAGEAQYLDAETIVIHTRQGRFEISAEIADEPQEQSRGLMFRTDLAPTQGMLFDFGQSRPVTMWMKNTPLSLDMIFIRPDGTVVHIAERTQPFSLKHVSSGEPVSHVLELRGGVARMIGLNPGDRVEHSSFDPD